MMTSSLEVDMNNDLISSIARAKVTEPVPWPHLQAQICKMLQNVREYRIFT